MYDLPELRQAHAAFCDGLVRELRAEGVPLTEDSVGDWPRFTQICGYPLRTTQRSRFAVIAAPSYDLPGCQGESHRAYIVVAADSGVHSPRDLEYRRFALNSQDSNSGMNLARHFFAPFARNGRFFDDVVVTGSHAASLALVASGGADAASIDCITFALLQEHQPEAIRKVRVLAETAPSPTPPFVTARSGGVQMLGPLRRALARLFARARAAAALQALHLASAADATGSTYRILTDYEHEARSLGYPVLA